MTQEKLREVLEGHKRLLNSGGKDALWDELMKEREEWETCPCGRLHYVDHDSIDWKRVGESNGSMGV